MKTPELLAPAGNLKNLRYAIAYGADAVYAGMPRYSLRVRNNDFDTLAQLQNGIDEVHAAGKQFFLASNVLPHNAKVKTFLRDVEPIIELGPDALIMADPGLIMMVREKWPEMPIHLSVQANTINYASVKFWQSLGLTRVILSRELSLDEVAEIRQQCPEMELEVFVHGALCIAYSGRCLLSGYFNHRDANQGTCTNSCRWQYDVKPAAENETGDVVATDLLAPSQTGSGERHENSEQVFLLEESERPGTMMPIEEDEHGTYIMNSKDLRAVEHVQRLVEIGVDSLKIEGRTKSHYYAARTAQVYRRAIDDAVAGRQFDPSLLGVLENLANRGYTDGFLQRHHSQEYQNYLTNHSASIQQQFVGEVLGYDSDSGLAEIEVKNKFAVGDTLEVMTPAGNRTITLESMQSDKGEPMEMVPGGGYTVRIPLPEGDYDKALITRNF
ncbi:MAG: tRNA 5-hydroxyuridine modification protein YegQ [Gammaproteobacteria bacterium]|nr:tRNA 5-hydroxyuridine modification protein YegQ [Gammaproteobacteria bacterium]MCW8973971.1 tRNA 5-hydroxyuridine modification protein YegQ [Gammaproteobacteria bacterium]MCW8993787.1 tRNA 5-hydroxyuridine modification protein YegQ [Gammaproteobacteria bacterium]